ncbi:hexokinase type 2-like [Scaptodrosophila lebanonensis]|uniref:Phosphotransferase n=1 Tax=Drosophila lebanonensis TaxID=7225 RepID=A0A6J2TGT4_DROLE|nr:hexokinase type 2-like [Scaptodrosophila lebanonensis]
MANTSIYPEALSICKMFDMSDEQMQDVVQRMTKEMSMGLTKETHPRAVIKCWITYVQDLPTGKERGKYLALDLGGTNFRVLLVHLKSEYDVDIQSKSYVMGQALMTGSGKDLFDFIAECLANFVQEHRVDKEDLPLGFTFSFPVQQLGLTKGILVTWTKGFSCDGVVGKNVVELLQEAIVRRGDLRINIVAILNDTTGTLMSCAFKKHNCRIGLIVGTGCNACYVEKTANAQVFEHYQTSAKPNMIINCEWGAFGDNGVLDFIRTPYDKIVDKQTPNVGRQTFEKCISGMYLGELVRLIIVDLKERGILFKNIDSQVLKQKWKFETKFLSEAESDPPGSFRNMGQILDQCGIRGATDSDKACVRYICETISRRSAKLVACGLVCLINRMGVNDLSVGIDGSVYRFHPKYHNLLTEYMNKLLKSAVKFELVLSEDGSGRGAALIAAVASQK